MYKNTAVISAWGGQEKAYVYNKIGDTWIQVVREKFTVLQTNTGFATDRYSEGISVYGDYIAIGSPQSETYSNNKTNTSTTSNQGRVLIYKLQEDGKWITCQEITDTDSRTGELWF